IATNGSAALRFLEHMPPNIERVRSALNRMIGGCDHASQIFDNIRALFGKGDAGYEPIDVNDLIQGVPSTVQGDLDDHGITTSVQLKDGLPKTYGQQGQVREGIGNPVRNGI